MGKKMTETTTIRGALVMSYPSALGPADEPLTIEWPEGHSYAVVATAFHGGAVLGTTATEDEAWEIYDQWPKTDCRCGCRGIVTRDGFRLRRGGSPQKILDALTLLPEQEEDPVDEAPRRTNKARAGIHCVLGQFGHNG